MGSFGVQGVGFSWDSIAFWVFQNWHCSTRTFRKRTAYTPQVGCVRIQRTAWGCGDPRIRVPGKAGFVRKRGGRAGTHGDQKDLGWQQRDAKGCVLLCCECSNAHVCLQQRHGSRDCWVRGCMYCLLMHQGRSGFRLRDIALGGAAVLRQLRAGTTTSTIPHQGSTQCDGVVCALAGA